jgi:hypothetical protein
VHFPPVRVRDNPRRRGVSAKAGQLRNDARAVGILFFNKKKCMMKKVLSSLKDDLRKPRDLSEGIQESINPFAHEVNIIDGAEFIDDKIRMKDQPYENKEAGQDE